MDSKLQDLSNGTKNTQIGLRMTKLWSYEVGAKTGKLQPRRDVRNDVATCRELQKRRRDVRNDVATWQRAAETTSRRCCTTSRRSGSILDGFLAHFEGELRVFLSKNPRDRERTIGNDFLGVFEGEQAPFGWKHPRACSWRDF